MFTGIPFIVIAFGTILGTIVIIIRTDSSGLAAASAWQRLWSILGAWMWHGNPAVYRKRYAVLLPISSTILYWCGVAIDDGFESTLGTAWFLVASRLTVPPGAVFGFCGVGYNVMFTAHTIRDRFWLQSLVFLILVPVSLFLTFLHVFALIGQRPPIFGW